MQKLAERVAQVGDILESIYFAAGGHSDQVSAGWFRFEDGDTHRAREFIDTVLELAAESGSHVSLCKGVMQKQKELKTAQDYLDAADREFENGDAVAATERLWEAMTHTVKTSAKSNGLSYDESDLFPALEQLVNADEQFGEILLTSFLAAKGHPGLFSAGYLRFESGDTHRVRRMAHEFVTAVQKLAGQ